jgi:cold shock CspA family protein
MQQGRVKKFSPDKRFGQIRPDGEKIDLFFHRDDVVPGGDLCFVRGAHVSFSIVPDSKHPGYRRAAQVTLIEETQEEKEKREKIQAIKIKGRQTEQAAKEKRDQIKQARKADIDQRSLLAQVDERRGRLEDSNDWKPAYIPDLDVENYFLSLPEEN